MALVEFLVGPLAPGAAVNLADALVAPDVLRPHLINWAGGRALLPAQRRGRRRGGRHGARPRRCCERLLGYDGVRAALAPAAAGAATAPVLPMHFAKDGTTLRLFTTIATLGTPQDITLQELRIESFFPMDEATRAQFRGWAGCVR